MNLTQKSIIFSWMRAVALWLMLVCCCAGMQAAGDGEIYSAALDNPAFPEDTVDADLKKLSAGAWLMVDGETGRVLSSKNPEKIMYPASMTKMMTCILACESGRLSEIVTISAAAASVPYGGVRRGEKYVLRDLLYRVMLPSDNGAAHAVGEFLDVDSVGFATLMNEKARALGMKNTNFVNAHGLPDDNHYTTAHDMMRLMRYCMRNKDFAEIVSNSTKDITTTAGKKIHLKSTNKLYGRYDGCIGVKTGTTRAAGGCLASAVERDGTRIYLVLMKSQPARARTDESIVLYDKGFEMMKEFNLRRRSAVPKRAAKRDQRANVPRPKNHSTNHNQLIKHQQEVRPSSR